ncbi:phosphoribosyltransferase family protein [Ferruginibacter yonginensis]|uniref:Phosphoribosyltransferase family protein n=1 Tax=Ferruginibacter yonginensis TaxID=1310416 RepID=A0ABV8QNV9_9BACT
MILTETTADKKLRRMALEIAERNLHQNEIIIIGIKENGIYIAHKIAHYLKEYFKGNIHTIALTINKKSCTDISLSEPIALHNKAILLIDDVANSGKTMMYAIESLLNQHPSQIETLALVERMHKTFPVALNYVGLSVATTTAQHIVVTVNEGVVKGASIINE